MKTPQLSYSKLSEALNTKAEIYLKREDLHPCGSHKGRSIPLMVKEYKKQGIKNFVISSSGNAALAAILTIQGHNQNNPQEILTLKVFIGKKIDINKLNFLQKNITDKNITLIQVENPKQQAFQIDKNNEAKNLRQSTDDLALEGFNSLAEELNKISNLEAIFIPTSSGTTAQGLAIAFARLEQKPQIHIVQTESCHPIAENFDQNFEKKETSIAGAIVDKIAHRKEKVVEEIKKSHGFGWIVNDEEIKKAVELVKNNCDIKISYNSALSVAGLAKAIKNNNIFSGSVVCLITGK